MWGGVQVWDSPCGGGSGEVDVCVGGVWEIRVER